MENQIEEYLRIIDRLRSENDELKRTIRVLEKNNSELKDENIKLSKRGGVDTTIEDLRRDLYNAKRALNASESKRAHLTTTIEELTKELNQSHEESRTLDEELAEAEIKLTELGYTHKMSISPRRLEANLVNKLVTN